MTAKDYVHGHCNQRAKDAQKPSDIRCCWCEPHDGCELTVSNSQPLDSSDSRRHEKLEPTSNTSSEIDALVRDACSVYPVAKSEYRQRLQSLLHTAQLTAQAEVLREIIALSPGNFVDDPVLRLVNGKLAEIERELKGEKGGKVMKAKITDLSKVQVWTNPVTDRIMAKAWIKDKWHEVAFPVNAILTMAQMIESLEDWDLEKGQPS